MTSLTRGHKGHSRRPIGTEQVRAIMSMRRQGMTCAQVAKTLGVGESTVARYSGAWWQKEGSKKFERQRKKGEKALRQRSAKVKKASKPTKPAKSDVLSTEQIDYINKIYRSGNLNSGTFVGNLFIRIGKFFGGHYPV